MVARLRWGANSRHQARSFGPGPLRQLVQLLQRRRQRAVAHRGGVGKTHPHHGHSAPSRCRCRVGGEFFLRRQGRAVQQAFNVEFAPWRWRRPHRSDMRFGARIARACSSATLRLATRSAVGWARMSPILSPASRIRSRRRLPANFMLICWPMMPQASESKPVGRLGSLRPRRRDEGGVANFEQRNLIVEAQHLQRGLMDKSHAGGTKFLPAWSLAQTPSFRNSDSSTTGPSTVGSAFQILLPSLRSVRPSGSRA